MESSFKFKPLLVVLIFVFLAKKLYFLHFTYKRIVWAPCAFFCKFMRVILFFLVIGYFLKPLLYQCLQWHASLNCVFQAAGKHHFCTLHWRACLDPSLAISFLWWMWIRYGVLILAWNLSYWLWNLFFLHTIYILWKSNHRTFFVFQQNSAN